MPRCVRYGEEKVFYLELFGYLKKELEGNGNERLIFSLNLSLSSIHSQFGRQTKGWGNEG